MGWVGCILHLQEAGMIVCTTNRTTQIPPLQISRRELQHLSTLLPTSHRHIIASLLSNVTSLQFLIILSYYSLDVPLLMSSQAVRCRAQSSIIYQVHALYRLLMSIRYFGYLIFVQPAGTRHKGDHEGRYSNLFKHCHGLRVSRCPITELADPWFQEMALAFEVQ